MSFNVGAFVIAKSFSGLLKVARVTDCMVTVTYQGKVFGRYLKHNVRHATDEEIKAMIEAQDSSDGI
ncbi:hypothetical protein NI468_02015 [Acinetobacter lwoffii]|uniref:hypothetical protein n=1 Tax=Acinetobacter lwoffii TaxID=28090 RepID=UPI002097A3D1|nr:hypothetical protein [Acinetobacter lwoffii]MCO8069318.1 hypothetical protein [Acinetobacter lwoffii]